MKWFDSDYDYIDEFTTQWNERYKKAKRMSIILSIVLIFIGILCFSFVVYTGEDLFNVSQVAYALPPYFIMLALSLSLSYNNIQSDESIYS